MKIIISKIRRSLENQIGFSLIEMIVALFAFSIILTIIGAVFVNVLMSQRRVLNAQKVEENVSQVMESITRELRVAQPTPATGRFDTIGDTNCPASPVATLDFYNSVGQRIVYSLPVIPGPVHRSVNGVDSVINSNTVQFTSLKFCIRGISVYGKQPRVTIIAGVQSTEINQQIKDEYQTTVSLRFLGI